ncbi:Flp pilus assembly protein CpaB [Streptomyces sp. NBC_00257]|uniref:Flp pilus assembly protein CpaB n=1 Tax=Streptomyces sanglieri TaxID=193460 RepID=A0ABW2WVM5_9ACTN|nr:MULTISPECIES: Flp pilus assembly protein CpaB [Streptomyces]WSG53029.1 Flp pilus assembly protein CpaB [Streptomyces sp. NBC_01732]WSW05696.1 Flp pilus assembly protein CpaB [Streptomyces sp. NBC_01005]WSX03672.1 Flp pilus assembly protein CpaB [Streptomyces sp. NBC_00987]WTB56439.1 Flp pilus assembly protein CpaB [Streptomyces sp. NBC_00826]WTC95199.1 Flp pilus assembly protein CpaB [Streptomyces sp. NBC_01650]WTH90677.1 Flp pilus assembly protein CpaB [Streptomyces sp. NBC_00825]WTH9940
MNSRQRRGVILLLLSVLCAFGAFAGVLSVISDVNSKVGPEVSAYQLKSDVAPYTALSSGQFEKISMPKRWLSGNAVTDLSEVNGKIAVTQLRKGSLLQSDMMQRRPELQPGEQEIAIMIDAATGVAGKITPGATVNIYATFAGENDGQASQSKVIVSNAKVLDVGKLTALEPSSDGKSNMGTEAVPITFALNTLDTQRIAYAESFAEHVRLALIASGSDSTIRPGDRTYTLDKDK